MHNQLHTVQKCQRILQLFEQLEASQTPSQPKQESAKRSHSKSQKSYYLTGKRNSFNVNRSNQHSSLSSAAKLPQRKASFSKDSSIRSAASLKKYVKPSCLGSGYQTKQSRLDKIMQLKVKPPFPGSKVEKKRKNILNTSLTSFDSERSDKENVNRQGKETRFQKIMKIKVEKPRVGSALRNYQPLKREPTRTPNKTESVERQWAKEWKISKEKIKKKEKQNDREDRLWKVFERERQIRMKNNKKKEEGESKQQRRRQKRFETLLSKELNKIESEKEIIKRKKEGFSNYIYPSY